MAKSTEHTTKHTQHTCEAIVVSCIDFRLRKALEKWTKETITGGFDLLEIAGGVKNLPFVLDQIELSYKLHNICKVYMINHEDCGAYGEEGNFKKHKDDLLFAKKIIREKFQKLEISLFYLKLNGEFVNV